MSAQPNIGMEVTTFENPQGVDGFEFVEFAAPDAKLLHDLFPKLGFTAVAKHKSKNITLYRQGEINFIINAELPEAGRFEQLWARQRSDGTFEICCIPFFLYDVALGDVVQTTARGDRQYILSEVVSPSQRYVFRVWFGGSDVPTSTVVERLESLGALMEWSSANLLAVDARDLQHAQEIADYLAGAERRGELVFETGRSG